LCRLSPRSLTAPLSLEHSACSRAIARRVTSDASLQAGLITRRLHLAGCIPPVASRQVVALHAVLLAVACLSHAATVVQAFTSVSHLFVVDLAGSERLDILDNEAHRKVDGGMSQAPLALHGSVQRSVQRSYNCTAESTTCSGNAPNCIHRTAECDVPRAPSSSSAHWAVRAFEAAQQAPKYEESTLGYS
jgi:hypothetical protein